MLPDLHRHLDGSLRPATLAELAHDAGVPVPSDLAFHAGMGLDQALARFAFTLSLLQSPEAVARVAHEICTDAAADGVSTLEIRFAPQLHGDIASTVDAALQGIAGRAGLVLCALYGQDPAVAMELARQPGIVGLDLAGGPAPGHRWGMADVAPAFELARDRGLGRTVHAGEGRPPAEIRVAIERLHAVRIGHGTTLLDDPDVTALVLQRGVTIEACVTSNVHVGAIDAVADHPVARWLEQGVRVCVCTDNTLLSATTSSHEHALAAGLGASVDALRAHGHAAAF
jgi:adenosine deaminase